MGWTKEPLARFRALVEGTYPAAPVAHVDRWIPRGTYHSVALHVALDDPEFPAAQFQGAYDILPESSGHVSGDINPRAGQSFRVLRVSLSLGYLFGQDAALVPSLGIVGRETAAQNGHDAHEAIEQVLRFDRNRGGTTPAITSIRLAGQAQTLVSGRLERLIVRAPYEIQVSYAPGTVFP